MANLSREDAVLFLRRCRIEDVEVLLESNKFQLLQRIPRALQENLPFQNFSVTSLKPSERKKHSMNTVTKNMLDFLGGLCIDLNGFAAELLLAIGFRASLLPSGVESESINHVVVLIEDVKHEGDKYVLDVGFGHPSFCVVPLDFDVESETFTDSILTYKYIKTDSGRYYRMHQKTRESVRPFVRYTDDGWYYTYWFALEKRTYEYLSREIERNVFTNLQAPQISNYRINGFFNGRFVAVSNFKVYEEFEPGKLKKIESDVDGVLAFIDLHFPAIDKQVTRRAMDNWLTYAVNR